MLIVLLPIIGVVLTWCSGRWIGRSGAVGLTSTLIGVAWILAVQNLFTTLSGISSSYPLGPWIAADLVVIPWGFHLDSLTAVMFVVVLSISFVVHLYSAAYMATDPGLVRFFSYLSFFTFFMLVLVSADNFVLLFVGW